MPSTNISSADCHRGFLPALKRQRRHLLDEIKNAPGFEPELVKQLDIVSKLFERLAKIKADEAAEKRDEDSVAHRQLVAFLEEMDDRVDAVARHRFAALANRIAEQFCDECAAKLRAFAAEAGATTTR